MPGVSLQHPKCGYAPTFCYSWDARIRSVGSSPGRSKCEGEANAVLSCSGRCGVAGRSFGVFQDSGIARDGLQSPTECSALSADSGLVYINLVVGYLVQPEAERSRTGITYRQYRHVCGCYPFIRASSSAGLRATMCAGSRSRCWRSSVMSIAPCCWARAAYTASQPRIW